VVEQDHLRQMIRFRLSPLLDLALSLLVIQNPERFGREAAWEQRVLQRIPAGTLDKLAAHGERVDLFGLAVELEHGPAATTPDLLRRYARETEAGAPLLMYWEAIAAEVAAHAGLLAGSIQTETARLAQMDPVAFICRFSDRVSVAGDGDALILHWGKGMRVPLADLQEIWFVPSAFCPRRLMFYRLGPVQIFFYDPLHAEPAAVAEAPESLVLGFSALADTTRLRLLGLIAQEGVPAQEMARRLGVNESTISRHLRMLVEAGLVGRERQEGKYVIYGLQAERIDELADHLKAYLGPGRTR